MKKKHLMSVLIFFQLCFSSVFAQIGIGTTTPNGALEINSSTNGVVAPNVALTAKNVSAPVVNPNGGGLVSGTLVWNTATAGVYPNNVTPGFYYWDGTNWISMSVGGQSSTTYFSTGSLTITAGSGFTYVPGFPTSSITIPNNCDVLLNCDIGVQTTSGSTTGYSSVDIVLIVDGTLLTSGGYQRVMATNNGGVTGAIRNAALTTAVKLTAGTHTFGIASAGTGIGSNATVGGNSSSVLMGELTVTIVKH